MEELGAIAVIALVPWMACLLADLFGLCIGLGWGHYSRKWRATRLAKDKLKAND